jgi:hypothetical protein
VQEAAITERLAERLSQLRGTYDEIHFYGKGNDHAHIRVDKAHIPRTGGRLTRCHWQNVEMHDVVPKQKKDIGWRDWDKMRDEKRTMQ